VPALILSGSLDQRTPTESARKLAGEMPRSELVVLNGAGHDTIDTDPSGCVATALARFSRGARVGAPCRGRDVRWRVAAALPAGAAQASPAGARTLPLARRRELGAILQTLQDAELHAYGLLYGGFASARGGGLIAGRLTAGNVLRLSAYESIPGVRLTSADAFGGRIDVRLPGGRTATVRIRGRSAEGSIGGRRFSVSGSPLLTLEARSAGAAQR
jgi:hypothetical protein